MVNCLQQKKSKSQEFPKHFLTNSSRDYLLEGAGSGVFSSTCSVAAEAPEQSAQSSSRCPIFRNVPSQVGWDFEKPHPMEGVLYLHHQ